MGSFKFILFTLLIGQAVQNPVLANSENSTLKNKKEARDSMLGPVITTGNGYVLRADINMSIVRKGKAICPSFMSIEEKNAKIAVSNKAFQAVISEMRKVVDAQRDKHMQENRALIQDQGRLRNVLQQKYKREQLSEQNFKAQLAELKQKSAAHVKQQTKQRLELEEKYSNKINAADSAHKKFVKSMGSSALSFSLLHTPTDPNSIIVPMSGNQPDAEFVRNLNKELQPFLNTCKTEPSMVYTHHYFDDAYRFGSKDTSVVSFRYNLEAGQLKLIKCDTPSCRAIMAVQGRSSDAKINSELTLNGFIASNKEKARLAGAYRKDFYDAAKRKKGIVYRYHKYWQPYYQFDGAEIPRRIFDGDFKGFNKTIEFKTFFSYYAEWFTGHCPNEVAGIKIYEIPSRDYVGTRYNINGSKTDTYQNNTVEIPVDIRFAPAWGNNYQEVKLHSFGNFVSDMTNNKGPDLREMKDMDDMVDASKGLLNRAMPGFMLAKMFLDKHPCDSAMVRQMTENLSRAAKGQPSAQKAGLHFVTATQESDPATKNGAVPSVSRNKKLSEQQPTANKPESEQMIPAQSKTPIASKPLKVDIPITEKQQKSMVQPAVQKTEVVVKKVVVPIESSLPNPSNTKLKDAQPKTTAQVFEINKMKRNEVQKHQQAYADAVKSFQLKMKAAHTQAERTTLQKAFMEQQTHSNQKMQEQLKKIEENIQ